MPFIWKRILSQRHFGNVKKRRRLRATLFLLFVFFAGTCFRVYQKSEKTKILSFLPRCSTWRCVLQQAPALDSFHLQGEIMNPFSPWYLCDFYIGREYKEWVGRELFEELSKFVSPAGNCDELPEFSTLFVQVDLFQYFMTSCLPQLKTRIILITGQWQLPMLEAKVFELVLNEPFIAHWFAQNSLISHQKLTPLPYGVLQSKLTGFLTAARESAREQGKSRSLIITPPMSLTHPSRKPFIGHATMFIDDYYKTVASAEYLVSPVGDRPDSYRHWEAIGLGAIPVCNCPASFTRLFSGSMLRVTVETMLTFLKNPETLTSRFEKTSPNKDLLCTGYWKAEIQRIKEGFRD